MQVGETPTRANHIARAELVTEKSRTNVVQAVGNWRNYLYRLPRWISLHSIRRNQIGIVQHVGRLLEAIMHIQGQVRAEAIAELDSQVLIGLVKIAFPLVKSKPWTVAENPMH